MATIRKKRRVYKGEEKSSFIVSYTDNEGKRHEKSFDRQREAAAYKLRVEVELSDGTHTPSSKLTISALSRLYIDHIEDRVKAGTASHGHHTNIRTAFKSSINPALGAKKIVDLTPDDVTALTNHMVINQGLQTRTVSTRRGLFGAFEEWCVRKNYTKKRVVPTGIKYNPLKAKEPIRIPTKDEVGRILTVLGERQKFGHPRAHMFRSIVVNLAVFCGMRCGEIMGLTADSVDFVNRTVRVRHSLTKQRKLKAPKTRAGVRDVPCPSHVMEMISVWVADHYVANEARLLFTSNQGRPVNNETWTNGHWHPIQKLAGISTETDSRSIHFHALRHFAGSFWLENGLAVPIVSKLMGHASPMITMQVYAHDLQNYDEKREMLDAMSAKLLAAGRGKNRDNEGNALISL